MIRQYSLKMKTERNLFIDMLRGVAALNIINIHTAWWSGETYIPLWFASMTLLIDVPFFFFLSGWGSSTREISILKSIKSLFRIWTKWFYFITLLALLCKITILFHLPFQIRGVTGFKDLIKNYFFVVSFDEIKVIAGSIWFMKWYIAAILINTIVLMWVKNKGIENGQRIYTVILFLVFVFVAFTEGDFFYYVKTFLFYSFFWMLGYNKESIQIIDIRGLIATLLLFLFGYFITAKMHHFSIIDVQTAKFPPSLTWGFFSSFFICVVMFMEPFVKNYCKPLIHIGQNAIFYFFGQGVGSSILYLFVNRIQGVPWLIKWGILFLINAFVTVIIAEMLIICFNGFSKLPNVVRGLLKNGTEK